MKKRGVPLIMPTGFTHIELLIVITIIAVLAANIFLFNALTYLKRSRDTHRKAYVATLQLALEDYYSETGKYPVSNGDDTYLNNKPCNNPFISMTGVRYLATVECDPLASKALFNNRNYYYYSHDGRYYVIATCLENEHDTEGGSMAPWDVYSDLYAKFH